MTWYSILVVLHVVGAAIGVGAAATSDSVFLASIRNRMVNHDQFLLISRASHIVLGGLVLIVLSGIGLLFFNLDLWQMPHFQAKMTAVIFLIVNGIIFHATVIPLLEENQHKIMPEEFVASKQWTLAITGTVSAVSWFAALIIAVIGDDIAIGYFVYLGIYLFMIVAGSVVADFMLTKIIDKKGEAKAESETAKEESDNSKYISLGTLSVLLLILIVALVYAVKGPLIEYTQIVTSAIAD